MAAHRDHSPLPDIAGWVTDHDDDERVTAQTPLAEAIRKIMDGDVALAAPPTDFTIASGGWVVDSTGKRTMYDPSARYMRATNKHDHSVVQRVHMPKDMAAVIGVLVGWDQHYQTPADFIRNAMIHQLWRDWAALVDGEAKNGMEQQLESVTLDAILERHMDEMESLRRGVERLDEALKGAVEAGDQLGAKLLIAGCLARIETIRAPYDQQMVEVVKKWQGQIES
jgi:hypothetical protein